MTGENVGCQKFQNIASCMNILFGLLCSGSKDTRLSESYVMRHSLYVKLFT